MKYKLDIYSVAVKQLESAIWMFAYNYDEVAVHTIAGAAFELYTKRLGLSSFENDIEKYIKQDKIGQFRALWNKPYNYFKHGEHRHKRLDYIIYDEESVEILIYLATEANLIGPEEFRLNCAVVYKLFFYYKRPELFNETFYKEHFLKPAEDNGISIDVVRDKTTLQAWLDSKANTFVNGQKSPFQNVSPRK